MKYNSLTLKETTMKPQEGVMLTHKTSTSPISITLIVFPVDKDITNKAPSFVPLTSISKSEFAAVHVMLSL